MSDSISVHSFFTGSFFYQEEFLALQSPVTKRKIGFWLIKIDRSQSSKNMESYNSTWDWIGDIHSDNTNHFLFLIKPSGRRLYFKLLIGTGRTSVSLK